MAKIDKNTVKALAKEHNIAMYSAKMVLKEKWSLDYALSLEKPVFNQGVRWLLHAKHKHWIMGFKTFDKGVVYGKVLKVRKYNVLLQTQKKLTYLEKIDTAFVFNSKHRSVMPEYVRTDPFVSDVKERPSYKPSDRKEVNLSAIQERAAVRVTLYSGEILEGLVNWITDYEFELRMDRYIQVLVFRHAICDAVQKEFHRFRQPIMKPSRTKPPRTGPFPPRRPFQQREEPVSGNMLPPKTPGGFGIR